MITFRAHSVFCFVVLTCFSFFLLTCRAQAQSTDDVHVAPLPVPAKDSPPPTADGSPALSVRLRPVRVDVDLVLVPVTVTDSGNHPVMNLNKQDFTVSEDGVPQQIQYFGSEDSPISVGLLVDLSGSMKNKVEAVREAVDQFFSNANPEDDYFVVTFSSRPQLLADTTRSSETIQAKLANIEPKGTTALADAIYTGVMKLHSAKYQRKALVIISDGGDNSSRYTLHEIRSLVMESDVQIYAIDICDAPSAFVLAKLSELAEQHWLSQVTDVTGGRTIAVDSATKIPAAAGRISSELRNQYVLGYRPNQSTRNANWRKIRVRVTRPKNSQPVQVYFKTGYVPPKP